MACDKMVKKAVCWAGYVVSFCYLRRGDGGEKIMWFSLNLEVWEIKCVYKNI